MAGNFLSRMTARAAGLRSYGRAGERLDKRLIYSRFRPVRVFRGGADSGQHSENYFTACAVMPDPSEYVLVGTYMGDVKMFDINTQQAGYIFGHFWGHWGNITVCSLKKVLLTFLG